MGEALISRTGGGGGTEEIITPVPGTCILNFKVMDSNNSPIAGMPVTCKDGSFTYKYNTNDKGIVRFTTNSGQCNITFNNILNNGVRILDHSTLIRNMFEAPVGSVINQNFQLQYSNYVSLTGSGNAIFLTTKSINVNVAGGGGGGGGAVNGTMWDDEGHWHHMGARGGAGGTGQLKTANSISVSKNEVYSFSRGGAGSGGRYRTADDRINTYGVDGGSGGTSYFGSYSGTGGGGGSGGRCIMNYGSPRSYDGSQGTSYSGGGYGGSGGSISPYASLGNNATSGSSGGNGWVYIWMTK